MAAAAEKEGGADAADGEGAESEKSSKEAKESKKKDKKKKKTIKVSKTKTVTDRKKAKLDVVSSYRVSFFFFVRTVW